ncbi:hypothetical protein AAU61_02130 [Desulfocarbo indianensis]|nr:hypothetical protein AAU61_02130 [Desulfocarbo indianensis]
MAGKRDVSRDIAQAKRVFAELGGQILARPELAGLLARFRRQIEATNRLFGEMDVAADCAACCDREKGPCCFDGAQGWYDLRLLLINLLLGVQVPDRPELVDDCWFNSPTGCKLLAKDSICLNFFCPDIQARLNDAELLALRQQVGRELLACLDLETALLPWLRARGVSWI